MYDAEETGSAGLPAEGLPDSLPRLRREGGAHMGWTHPVLFSLDDLRNGFLHEQQLLAVSGAISTHEEMGTDGQALTERELPVERFGDQPCRFFA
jgi:hypothetical protein